LPVRGAAVLGIGVSYGLIRNSHRWQWLAMAPLDRQGLPDRVPRNAASAHPTAGSPERIEQCLRPVDEHEEGVSHKIANVLGVLPKSAHPGAKKALAEIWNAEDRRHAPDAVTALQAAYGPSSARPSRRSPTISTSYWPSTTSRPSTGSTCAQPTRSNRPSPPFVTARRSPAGQAHARQGWRWRSSSSRPPRTLAGGQRPASRRARL
jgi:hypothetical protein